MIRKYNPKNKSEVFSDAQQIEETACQTHRSDKTGDRAVKGFIFELHCRRRHDNLFC